MNDPKWIFETFGRNCEYAFTKTLILINAKLAKLELIKPLTIQITNVHHIPYYRVKHWYISLWRIHCPFYLMNWIKG